jgi:hypothetical protein
MRNSVRLISEGKKFLEDLNKLRTPELTPEQAEAIQEYSTNVQQRLSLAWNDAPQEEMEKNTHERVAIIEKLNRLFAEA